MSKGRLKAKQDAETDFPSDLYKDANSEHSMDFEFFSLPAFIAGLSS